MTSLFDNIARTDQRPGNRTESLFAFLNRTDRDGFANVRQLMDAWFAAFPVDARVDLRERFRSNDPGQCLGAFWELYLHEIHRRLGYAIERDPVVPGTTKRPDFLVTRDEEVFYLEATIVSYSRAEMTARTREAVVLDLVDEAFSQDFWVAIRILVVGQATPSRREIVPAVENWLATLDWDVEQARHLKSGAVAPEWTLKARDWTLRLRAYPRPEAARGDRGFPTIGMGPSSAGYVDERRHIEADLRAKSTRYGHPDRPFVIAALCVRDFVDDRAIGHALFGPEQLRIPVLDGVGTLGSAEVERDPRGFWQWGREARATRVSAVLAARHLNPWLLTTSSPTLWLNPWAARPLTADLPWKRVVGDLAENRLITTDASQEAWEILGLDPNWPADPPLDQS